MDFERLANRHKDAVYRQMVRVCGNRDDAEDVLVDALLSAYQALDTLRDEAAFRGWLARIATRICGRMRHRSELRPLVEWSALEAQGWESADPAPAPDAEAIMRHMQRCVSGAVEFLPAIYREVYVMRELETRPAEEVAEALGLTVSAVKSRLHRARHLVRGYFDENACSAD
ncbi:MAG: sigma-70 family RNA polymerase sigma factor [Fimbriimonadaceae bacterium]|nr:sigma-70 family RNA polymerase sigma factor [Fimbriimonadaceae bacterium]